VPTDGSFEMDIEVKIVLAKAALPRGKNY